MVSGFVRLRGAIGLGDANSSLFNFFGRYWLSVVCRRANYAAARMGGSW